MGMMSRRKGAEGERDAAAKLNEVLGTKFHRGRQYHGGPESPDLASDLPGAAPGGEAGRGAAALPESGAGTAGCGD
jgi:hypothetical protein